MPETRKPTLAFFDFASCEGCQIEFTNYGDEATLELLKHVDIVEFREAMTETTTERIDIALVEGSFTREEDRARLQEIRRRARTVIAYGACACTGGINALKNHQDDFAEYVYGDDARMPHLRSGTARPISAAIKVDYEVLGCPMSKEELLIVIVQPAARHDATWRRRTRSACSASGARRSAATTRATTAWARSRAPAAARRARRTASRARRAAASSTTRTCPRSRRCSSSAPASRQKRAVGKSRMFTANLRS